jgi:DNA-binding response OmpR family regulator
LNKAVGKKILIVEDEKPIAKALELKLDSSGFEADIAGDGNVALDKVAAEKYDLVLLDIVMPNLDGFGFLSKVKEKNIAVPVIVTSNLSQEEDINKAKALGAVDYYVKSNTPLSSIVEKINKFLT